MGRRVTLYLLGQQQMLFSPYPDAAYVLTSVNRNCALAFQKTRLFRFYMDPSYLYNYKGVLNGWVGGTFFVQLETRMGYTLKFS